MKVEYINPFLDATIKVLKTMAFTEATAGKPYVKKGEEAKGDVTGIIGITGDVGGSLSITFTGDCICNIVSNMFGETIKEVNDEVKDAVGELTNMISGDARRVLDDIGLKLVAAIPSVISGKNHSIKHMVKGPVIAIPFSTNAGPFTVEVTFNQ
jgi:chemotaxis protein CheX